MNSATTGQSTEQEEDKDPVYSEIEDKVPSRTATKIHSSQQGPHSLKSAALPPQTKTSNNSNMTLESIPAYRELDINNIEVAAHYEQPIQSIPRSLHVHSHAKATEHTGMDTESPYQEPIDKKQVTTNGTNPTNEMCNQTRGASTLQVSTEGTDQSYNKVVRNGRAANNGTFDQHGPIKPREPESDYSLLEEQSLFEEH